MPKSWIPAVAVFLSSLGRPSLRKLFRGLTISTLGVAFATSSMAATNQSFTTVDPPGSITTNPTSINAAGVVTGWFTDSSGTHGFLFANGAFTIFDVTGSTGTVPTSINAAGVVTGR